MTASRSTTASLATFWLSEGGPWQESGERMKAEQVDQALEQKFITEEERLVFWHDADGEFAEYVKGQLSVVC